MSVLSAQSLIEVLPASAVSGLTVEQYNRWMILENERPDDTLYVMNPIDFSQIDAAGYFKISLPGGCENVICKTTKRVSYPNGNYTVLASVEESQHPDGNCGTGDLGFVREHGITVGIIRVDDRAWEIRDLKEGKWCLRTVNMAIEDYCPSGGGSGGLFHEDEDNIQTREDFCVVQVLILFDNQANALNDIEQLARADIERTNQALRNSNINHWDLRLEIIGFNEYNVVAPTPDDPLDDLREVRDANQNLRNALGADIVMFYTGNTDYLVVTPNGIFDILGVALGLELPNIEVDIVRDAFALVEASPEARARFTFSHELAHLFQCRHQEQNDPNGEFQHGHRFWFQRGLFGMGRGAGHTIMHTIQADGPRLLYFSNPNVVYRGAATGVADIRDNARQLRNIACEVAQFREGQQFVVFIEGENVVCPYMPAILNAVITGNAPPPFTLQWESSTSFLGPYTFSGTSPSVGIPTGMQGETVFVRLTATDANGQTAIAFFEIYPTDGTHCTPWLQGQDDGPADLPVEVQVWPNPAGDQFDAKILVKKSQEFIRADLLSPSGEVFQSRQWKEVSTGPLFNEFNTSALPSGIYRLRVVFPQGVISTPIIKR